MNKQETAVFSSHTTFCFQDSLPPPYFEFTPPYFEFKRVQLFIIMPSFYLYIDKLDYVYSRLNVMRIGLFQLDKIWFIMLKYAVL